MTSPRPSRKPRLGHWRRPGLLIGIIWINHHATLRRLRVVDHTLLLLNLALLLMIGVIPWSTALLAAYLREPHGDRVAAVIYGGSFLLVTAAFYALQRHILFHANRLTHEHVDDAAKRRIDRRGRVGLLPYLVATATGLISAYLTLGICALIAIYYALPTTIYERE